QPAGGKCECVYIQLHLAVVAGAPIARLAIREIALIALDAPNERRNHLLARPAIQERLCRQVEMWTRLNFMRCRVRRDSAGDLSPCSRLFRHVLLAFIAKKSGRMTAFMPTSAPPLSCVVVLSGPP